MYQIAPPAIPDNASASQLESLAKYFEAQAAFLRSCAYEAERKTRAAEAARERRETAKQVWVKIGARAHVLRARGLEWSAVSARLMCAQHIARTACGEWRRKKQARRLARRNREILRLTIDGVKAEKIAVQYGITARQVRAVIADRMN